MDLRLWRQLRSAKSLALGLGISSTGIGVLIVLQAGLLSGIVSMVYIHETAFPRVWPLSLALLAVIALRAVVVGIQEHWALRHAAEAETQLRQKFVSYLLEAGPMAVRGPDSGELINLAVQGIEDLEIFLARYFPQIITTAAVPAIVWVGVVIHDWLSGLILLLTLPIIPLFMILIGWQADKLSQRQIGLMNRLSGHFLDVLHGLDTLKLFGRSRMQSKTVYDQSEAFRASTMAALRIAFLSGMVLELIASLSMAFIAVAVGLRLIHGRLAFETAFMVLVLVPEFYVPWRSLGAKFHEGLKGASAAKEIFKMMEAPSPVMTGGDRVPVIPGPWPILWQDVSFTYLGRSMPAIAHLTLPIEPGEHLAIVGPSGSGKSTFVHLLMGLNPFNGSIQVAGLPLWDLDLSWWRRQMTWVTQRPYLFDGTILENLQLVRPNMSPDDITKALVQSSAWDFVSSLPQGWDTPVGQEGFRLSGGQRQRLALARAFLLDTPIIIFDEPTQNLDLASEEALLGAMERLSRGRTTITIAHRLTTIARADRIMVMQGGRLAQWGSPAELRHEPGLYRSLIEAYEGKEPIHESFQADQVL